MKFLKLKKISFILFVVFLAVAFSLFFLLKDKGNSEGSYKIDYYVKNKTWNTDEKKEVPYKKGDKVEYTFIVRNYEDFSKRIDIALDKMKEKLNLENVSITGSKSISGDSAGAIKVSGETKESGISSKDFDEIFDFQEGEPQNEKDNIQEDKESEETEDTSKQKEEDAIESNTGKSDISISFENDSFFSDVDNLIRLTGSGLDNIKAVGIGDESFKFFSKDGNYYIYVPEGSLETGRYFTFVVKEDDTVIGLDKAVNFQHSGEDVVVFDIFPPEIKNDISRWITVQGEGLENTVSVQLSNSNIFKDTTEYKVVSDNVLAVKIPGGVSTGEYYINVMTTDGIYKFEDKIFQIY